MELGSFPRKLLDTPRTPWSIQDFPSPPSFLWSMRQWKMAVHLNAPDTKGAPDATSPAEGLEFSVAPFLNGFQAGGSYETRRV